MLIIKNLILSIFLVLICFHPLYASSFCFLLSENRRILDQQGNCTENASPCSTFKIILSLIGYESHILLDNKHPVWPYKDTYVNTLAIWRQPHDPSMWMKNSTVWYSQVLTQRLGKEKLQYYIDLLQYGNRDLRGDPGKDNGLTRAWLSSSLKISPYQQNEFLQKLVDDRLPFTLISQVNTRQLLFIENWPKGWKLYGKTGSGNLLTKQGKSDPKRQIGWFVGWLQKSNRKIIFTYYLQEDQLKNGYASLRAKKLALEELKKQLIL